MGEIVNLNRYRKMRAQQQREQEAGANRTKFGRTKAEAHNDLAARERAHREFEGKKFDEPA